MRRFICILLIFSINYCGPMAFAAVGGPMTSMERARLINEVLEALEIPGFRAEAGPANSPQNTEITFKKQPVLPPDFNKEVKETLTIPDYRLTKISGVVQTAVGINSDGDAIFTRANPDLNERNYRLLTGDQLNNYLNTYDPAIFSRLKVVMDASIVKSVSGHMNLTVDPWSFAGKSNEVEASGVWGDHAFVRYLSTKATTYTMGQSVLTRRLGDGFSTQEIKLNKGKVPQQTVTSAFGDTFTIPEADMDFTFMPIREAWVDYQPASNFKMRVFPMAYGDQALTSDDPLKLSNNKTYWEESPWLHDWQGGIHNTFPNDYTRGMWDNTLSFLSKDSDGLRLTALRGASVDINPDGDTSLKATVASPKTLWQNYGDVTALPASARLKHFFDDRLYAGAIVNAHQGYIGNKRDADNYTGGVDAGVMPIDGIELTGQYSQSKSHYDLSSERFQTKKQGEAILVSLEASTNSQDMLKKDYFGLLPLEKNDAFYKSKLYWAKMEEDFESSLSNYHQTRRDTFWSRHLTFYPSIYRHMPGLKVSSSEYDLDPFALGDGIDYDRSTYGWRGDAHWFEGKLKGLLNIYRSMTSDHEHHLETVSRAALTYQPTSQLTTKALYIWDAQAKTTAGFDPFIYDGDTGNSLANAQVAGGKDPSLKTGALGARYALTDWAAVNGVWEHTNDSTRATDNFPRGVLNSASFSTYSDYGNTYRQVYPFLYSQGHFPQAPYPYFNIFKTGLELHPTDPWHIYFDYTRNTNEYAGNIDDNINHFGVETAYTPNDRLGFFARYTFSRWIDLDKIVFENEADFKGYHNVFLESRWVMSPGNLLSVSYGVGPSYNVATSAYDPKLAYYSTAVLDTQHIFRLLYERKF